MRAKSESGFEDVSRLFFNDFGGVLVSILGSKIDKNRTTNRWDFRNDFKKGRLGTGTTAGIRNDAKGAGPAEGAGLSEA